MGLVGDAVAMSVFTSSIVTIGVANWGKTMNRDMLHVDNAVSTILKVKYHSSTTQLPHNCKSKCFYDAIGQYMAQLHNKSINCFYSYLLLTFSSKRHK